MSRSVQPKLRRGIAGLGLLVSGLMTGCNNGADSAVFADSNNIQHKPLATQVTNDGKSGLDATGAAPTTAASVTYVIIVTSNSGDQVCNGTAQINIMSNFTMKFPEAQIKCLTLTIDLAGMLGSSFNSTNSSLSNLSSDGQLLYIKQIANATFTPPRPFLLGPVIQNPSSYQGYHKTIQETVAVNDPQAKINTTAQGQFDVQVHEVDTTYTNKLSPNNSFNHVLHWSIKTSGFQGVPAKDGLLLKNLDWYFNTNPIMIPKISISGSLSDFISSDGGSSAASDLIGDVRVDLSVQSYDFGG